MAGDWMKVELDLPDKPEIHYMAGALNLDPDAVVGKLLRVWGWFDKHTENGNATNVTYSLIDRITSVNGFAEAMSFAGWLEQDGRTLIIPKFDRHNGKSAKKRALTAKRVNSHKQKSNADGNATSVTSALPREEKRREDKRTIFIKPSIEELSAYFVERGMNDPALPNRFLNHYDSNGWRVGKNPMKDWKAAVRTWEQNQKANHETDNRTRKPDGRTALERWEEKLNAGQLD